jgi:hypothetical protein
MQPYLMPQRLCQDHGLTGSYVFTFSGGLGRRCPEVGFEEISRRSPFLDSFRFAEIRELRSIALVLWRHRGVDLRYFGHLPWIRNRFSARSYPLESTFMLVP